MRYTRQVEGAHLKPLERGDKTPRIGVQWNPMIGTKSRYPTSHATSEKLACDKYNSEVVAKKSSETRDDFLQCWEKIVDTSERFTYIWNLR